jgi:RHS repeat-associated protein
MTADLPDDGWRSRDDGWSRMADRVNLGRDEQVRVDYRDDGNWTFTTTGRDHLGTARAEVYGNNMWLRLDLWPYGELRKKTPHNTTRTLANGVHLFTGHERDWIGTVTDPNNPRRGLDYMHARYYTFDVGRFMSVDPVSGEVGSSQSWNRYGYVRNRPLVEIDPTGEISPGAAYGNMLMLK